MSLAELEKASTTTWVHNLKDQLKDFIYARSREAFAAGDAARDAVTTVGALQARKQKAREVFLAGIGGLPPLDTPLNARLTGVIEEDAFRIEKVIFESRPNTFVTANLYVPNDVSTPRGAVLFVSGHHDQGKHVEEYQIVCRHLVMAGLIVLAQDPIGQGERLSYYEKALGRPIVVGNVNEHDYAGTQCLPLGDGIARYFTHDAMRGVDYLMTRPEVNRNKIGVTGNSGGGLQTAMLMLADPRIAAAAPGTFIMNRRVYQQGGGAQDSEQIWPGFTAAGFDHEDILLGMCPKPVCVLAVTSDFFPIEGTRETVARCRRLWKLAGREADLELVEEATIHRYTPVMAQAAARFFSRHLLGKEVRVDSSRIRPLEPQRLWCTTSGQVRGELAGARAVFDESQDRLAALKPAGRDRVLAWLRGKVLNGRRSVPLNLRVYPKLSTAEELVADLGYWWSQEGIFNEGLLFRSALENKPKLPVTLAVWDGGTTALHSHSEWLRQTCGAGRAVLVLCVSGVGGSEPNPLTGRDVHEPLGTMHKLNDDLIWLGDSLCALRTWDVLRALEVLGTWPGVDAADVQVYAHGRHGVYAELAAAIEPRLARIEVVDAMESYAALVRARYYDPPGWRVLLLPGILRHTDLPELRSYRSKERKGSRRKG